MSGFIWPNLPGQQLIKRRRPTFNTHTQRSLSGKESRIALRVYPLYEWELSFDWLPDNALPAGPARTNVVTYSQDMTQWALNATGTGLAPVVQPNITAVAAPDGTLTADQVVFVCPTPSGVGNASTISLNLGALPAGPYTGSIWLRTLDGSTVQAGFHFSGAPGSNVVTVTPTWQRFTLGGALANAAQSTGIFVNFGQNLGTSAFANLAVWGAQVEPGSYATAYIPTNGVPLRQSDLKTLLGLFESVQGQYDTFLLSDPSFNTMNLRSFATGNGTTTAFNLTAAFTAASDIPQYGAVAQGLASLAEWVQNTNGAPSIYTARYGGPELLSTGSRTNLLLQSNAFTTTWTANNLTLTSGAAQDPAQTTTAWKLDDGVAVGVAHDLIQSATTVAGVPYTTSIWGKAGQPGQYLTLTVDDGTTTNGYSAQFDLVNGVVSSAVAGYGNGSAINASIQIFVVPGATFFRIAVTGLLYASTTSRMVLSTASAVSASAYPTYTGAHNLWYIWQAQMERGMLPTAIIPTTTATATNGGSDYSLTNLSTAGTAVYTFQQVQMALAPASGAQLLWSGSFFYRVRFSEDALEPEQLLASAAGATHGHWKLDAVKLEQVLL